VFNKELVPLRVSKEDTTRVELGEIKQRTVLDFTVQELLPQVDKHHPRDREILGFGDSNLLITHSSDLVSELWIQTDIPHPDVDQDTVTGRVGEKGILTTDEQDFSGPTMGLSYRSTSRNDDNSFAQHPFNRPTKTAQQTNEDCSEDR
jgi:hypothetical protein